MKQLLFVLFLLPFIAQAQYVDAYDIAREKREQEEKDRIKDSLNRYNFPRDASGNIVYTAVIKVDEANAQDLYSRGKLFVADAFKSNKDVTQLNDEASKVILIKPSIPFNDVNFWGAINLYIHYQLKIECKDNRYRYTVDGFNLNYLGKTGMIGPMPFEYKSLSDIIGRKMWLKIQEKVDVDIKLTISLLQKQMSTKIADF